GHLVAVRGARRAGGERGVADEAGAAQDLAGEARPFAVVLHRDHNLATVSGVESLVRGQRRMTDPVRLMATAAVLGEVDAVPHQLRDRVQQADGYRPAGAGVFPFVQGGEDAAEG